MTDLRRLKRRAFESQAGRCFYCEQPMWLADAATFAQRHNLSAESARHLQVTAEHVIARSCGGRDESSNIVAACRYCNTRRHRAKDALQADAYLTRVRRRLAHGKWHGLRLAHQHR
ncbi:restriction endonuclease [Sphingomonas sp. ABOLG]|nr:restriction endonuclease [Sphingomonas sp. ABOLG]